MGSTRVDNVIGDEYQMFIFQRKFIWIKRHHCHNIYLCILSFIFKMLHLIYTLKLTGGGTFKIVVLDFLRGIHADTEPLSKIYRK